MELRKLRISDLNPAEYNPRVGLEPGDPDYEKLKSSIHKFGHVQPIVWNQNTGNVVGGHQSLKVLQDLGATEADCVVVDMELPEEKALNIALNKITGRWDVDKLSGLLDELVGEGLSMFTGYEDREIERLMEEITSEIQEVGEIDTEEYREEAFDHKCPRCGFLY